MAGKRRHLVALLLAAGIFTSTAHAEEQVNLINNPTALKTLTQLLEKGDQGILGVADIVLFQGELSNHDVILRDYLVKSDMYNPTNADFFVRSITQDDVKKMIDVLNDKKLKETLRVAAITTTRPY